MASENKKPKEIKTEIEIGDYKGFPTLTIWELGDRGEKKNLLGFGKKKAQAIVKYIEEIKKFAES